MPFFSSASPFAAYLFPEFPSATNPTLFLVPPMPFFSPYSQASGLWEIPSLYTLSRVVPLMNRSVTFFDLFFLQSHVAFSQRDFLLRNVPQNDGRSSPAKAFFFFFGSLFFVPPRPFSSPGPALRSSVWNFANAQPFLVSRLSFYLIFPSGPPHQSRRCSSSLKSLCALSFPVRLFASERTVPFRESLQRPGNTRPF